MSRIKYIPPKRENTSPINRLLLLAGVTDNNATTKYQAVKPSRNPLAIFVPKINPTTNRNIATGAKRHIFNAHSVTSYGGLIRPNTIAFMVNKSSRLDTVVETRHPLILGGIQTTKYQGGYHA